MKTQLKQNEKLILESKQHWFTLVGPFLIMILVSLLFYLITTYWFIISIGLIIWFVYEVIKRNNNLWAVTNLRVIDEFGVFSNNSKESPLDKINNISFHQSIIGKLLGYGNIQIQTAAEICSTVYFAVENPMALKDTITRMQAEFYQNQISQHATELASAIVDHHQNNRITIASELEKLYDLKLKGVLNEEEYNSAKEIILRK